MGEGRSKAAWLHTSAVLAMLWNAHKAPEVPARDPDSFNPHTQTEQPSRVTLRLNPDESIAYLEAAYCRRT